MSRQVSPAKRKTQRGSALVEGAFIFLVLFGLLIGTFDFGQFLFIHQALVERARFAARWGLVNAGTTDQVKNMVLYYQSTNPGGSTPGYLGLRSSDVTVTAPSANTWDSSISILISGYNYTILSPYIAGTYSGPNINVSIPLGKYN